MPQNKSHSKSQRNKKKGHAPAHQNTFAFHHNPKSKKTARILELPNQHVCRRCHDKIEWRKKYRKYKPRTQPGSCNICKQRRVLAAYHTICEPCSRGDKAKQTVKSHLLGNNHEQSSPLKVPNIAESTENVEDFVEKFEDRQEHQFTEKEENNSVTGTVTSDTQKTIHRACAMCVKEFALPDAEDEDDNQNDVSTGKRLTLRQRKTLERQKEKERNSRNRKSKHNDDNHEADENDEDDNCSRDDEENSENLSNNDEDVMDLDDDEDDGEEDPFLRAVGGAGKLLTGEAYQQALLQKEREKRKLPAV